MSKRRKNEPRPPRNKRSLRTRWAMVLASCFGCFFLLGFLASTQLPRIERYARVKIEELSRAYLPARIFPGKIEVIFLPPSIVVHDVRVLPKPSSKEYFDRLVIGEAHGVLSIARLLQGHISIGSVELIGLKVAARIPASKATKGPPLAGLFDALDQLPIDRLALENASVSLDFASPAMTANVARADISVEKTRSGLALSAKLDSLSLADKEGHPPATLDWDVQGVVSRKSALIAELKARRGDSYMVASGEFKGDVEALEFSDYDGETRASIDLAPLRESIAEIAPAFENKIPALEGRLFFEVKARKLRTQAEAELSAKAKAENLRIFKHILLGEVALDGAYHDGAFRASGASIKNSAGRAEVSEFEASRKGEEIVFSAKGTVPEVDLHKLLPELGTPEIPVWLMLSGDIPECHGTLSPDFKLMCRAQVKSRDGLVKSGMLAKSRIVAWKDLQADGEFSVDAKQTTYKAELKTPHGQGRSSGSIAFEKGFDISYEADTLDFADLETLGELKLEGQVSAKGTTSGDTKAAVFSMQASGKNLWLEDWELGDGKTLVDYRVGTLSFQNLAGNYSASRYQGKVSVDFPGSMLYVDIQAPFVDAKDLLHAVSRRFIPPVAIAATGEAQIKLSGPFRLSALTYDLKSTFYHGSVAKEPFDQARFDVRARKGEVETSRAEATRGGAAIRMEGRGHPSGDIDVEIRGRGLRLENLNAATSSGIQAGGALEFEMALKGPVLAPSAELRGSVSDASIGDQAVADSSFRLDFNKRTVEGGGALLGGALKADFVYPLVADAPFALNFAAQDWNFAPIFGALAGQASRKEYEGRLTCAIRLSSPSGGFWNSSGSMDIEKFLIRRGSVALSAPRPLRASMKDGRIDIERFELEGDSSSVKATNAAGSEAKLDAQFSGKIDLGVIALLTPFFEDLRGSLSFAFNVRGGQKGAAVLGSAYVDHGYLKIFDFPHPFRDLKADVLFNEHKLILNSLKGEFAGGKLVADGSMEFKGYKNFPLQAAATITDVTLDVPSKVMTHGSGQLSFSGNWFPFLMRGNYEVKDGLIGMEFEQGSGSAVKRSAFLPAAILQQSAAPITMDIGVAFPHGIEIKNKLVDGRASGSLQIRGAPGKPALAGAITADKDMKVTFRDSVIFDVLTGTATFDDPIDSSNPRLYVSARTHIQTSSEEYDINLVVQGRAKDPKVTLTSQPPRDEKDIISILALGTDATVGDATASANASHAGLSSGSQASGTGAFVGTQILSKPVTEEFKKSTGIDVQVTSGLDDNDVTVPKVVASRQFTPKFSVIASRSFGQDPTTNAALKYRLTQKVSAVGSFEALDHSDTSSDQFLKEQQDPTTLNKFGLDLEYKFEFK